MDVTFMILATLVAGEHIYIMCLETIFTKSGTTARTFNMEVEELSRPSVSTLFKNQGVYNLLLAVLILIAVWVTNDLFWTRCFLGSVLKPSCKSILLSTQFHKYLLPLHHEE